MGRENTSEFALPRRNKIIPRKTLRDYRLL